MNSEFYQPEDLSTNPDFHTDVRYHHNQFRFLRGLRATSNEVLMMPSGPIDHTLLVPVKRSIFRRVADHPVAALSLIVATLLMMLFVQRGNEYNRVVRIVEAAPKTASPIAAMPHLFAPVATERLSYSFLSPTGNVDDFCEQIQMDSRFQFNCARRQEYRVSTAFTAFIAGWKPGHGMFWSSKPRLLKEGTLIFTDGENSYVAACGNKISFVPGPTDTDVPDVALETPVSAPESPVTLIPPVSAKDSPVAQVESPKKRGGFPLWIIDAGIIGGGLAAIHHHQDTPSTWTPPPSDNCSLEIACR